MDAKVIPGLRSERPLSIEKPSELLLAISFLPGEQYVPPTYHQPIPALPNKAARRSSGVVDADGGRPITPRRSDRLSGAANRERTYQIDMVVSFNPSL